MLKKILATALAAAMIFAMAGTVFAASPFPDTAGVANEAVIARLKALGIVKGDDLGNFNPNNPITRAEFTTMVVRMLGLETAASYVATPTQFPDVTAASAWAYGYINIATNRGLIKGYEDGTFRPNNNVTQAEALTILLRALGYTDNLPGNWPIDYIMMGAELGVISTGFAPDVPATRALIATLVNNTLDENLVKEDVTAAGTFVGFVDKFATPTTLYQNAFEVAATDPVYLSGLCTVVDTTNGTITIAGTTKSYISGVTVYGKDTIKELEGQMVKATLNKDGKVAFVAVSTKQEVTGDITAVDTVKNTVTVGGTVYTVLTDAQVYKNTVLLTTTIAGSLTSINGTSAKLLLNDAGKVYRIYASILDQKDQTVRQKETVTTTSGVKNYVYLGAAAPGTRYEVPSTATIVRNGAEVTFADLKVDDNVRFSATATDGTGKIVYLDAWANVIENYTVVSVSSTGSGYTLVLTKDGVQSTFNSSITAVPGQAYNFTLDRDGKITAASPVTPIAPELNKLRKVASKHQELVNNVVQYKVTFDDGYVLSLNSLDYAGGVNSIIRKDGDIVTYTLATAAADLWAAIPVGSKVIIKNNAGSDAHDITIYSETVTGQVANITPGTPSTFELWKVVNGTPTKLGTFAADWDAIVTLNGARIAASNIPNPVGLGANGSEYYTATVTLKAESHTGGQALVSEITMENFLDGQLAGVPASVKSVTTAGSTTTVTYDAVTADYTFTVSSSTKIMKDGVVATIADIQVGNLVQVNVANGAAAPYVKVTTDTKKPVVNNDGSFTVVKSWNDDGTTGDGLGTLTLTVTFTTPDACTEGYVWYNGVKYTATRSGGTWTCTISVSNVANPATYPVTAVVVDYAGNVSDGVSK